MLATLGIKEDDYEKTHWNIYFCPLLRDAFLDVLYGELDRSHL